MSTAPPPLASPPAKDELGADPSPSGSHNIATIREALAIADQAVEKNAVEVVGAATATAKEAARTEVTRIVASGDVKWFLATMAAVAVGAVLLVGWFDARGQSRQDAGLAPIEDHVVRNEKRIEKAEAAIGTLDVRTARMEVMVEMLVTNRGLTPPPKVSADGGP